MEVIVDRIGERYVYQGLRRTTTNRRLTGKTLAYADFPFYLTGKSAAKIHCQRVVFPLYTTCMFKVDNGRLLCGGPYGANENGIGYMKTDIRLIRMTIFRFRKYGVQ